MLQEALHLCGQAGVPHKGNLIVLFVSAQRAAASPPAALQAEAAEKRELPLLKWLSARRCALASRAERFKHWKALVVMWHPDKQEHAAPEARLEIADRCGFLYNAKVWFVA